MPKAACHFCLLPASRPISRPRGFPSRWWVSVASWAGQKGRRWSICSGRWHVGGGTRAVELGSPPVQTEAHERAPYGRCLPTAAAVGGRAERPAYRRVPAFRRARRPSAPRDARRRAAVAQPAACTRSSGRDTHRCELGDATDRGARHAWAGRHSSGAECLVRMRRAHRAQGAPPKGHLLLCSGPSPCRRCVVGGANAAGLKSRHDAPGGVYTRFPPASRRSGRILAGRA
jgi:hypothetical protein